jgi:N-acetylmuramoyl-L-alanine amidase
MRKALPLIAVLGIWAVAWVGDALAVPRLLGVRKSSSRESTRVVLDLETPPVYEVQSSAASPILTIYLQRLTLPQGAREILIEDRLVRKVRIDPGDGESTKVILFLYQPTRSNVFVLKPEGNSPDRLVIDVFRPTGEIRDKSEKPEGPLSKQESGEEKGPPAKAEKPESKPPVPPSEQAKRPPAEVERRASKLPGPELEAAKPTLSQVEDPPRAVSPEQPRELGTPPATRPARLVEVRYWSAPEHTRVVADLEGTLAYEILPQPDPLVSTLKLRGIVLPKGSQEITVGDPVIRKIRLDPEGSDEARLSLFLVKPVRLEVFLLNPFEDKPARLVIDVSRPDLEEREKEQRQFTRELKAKKKRIVVIDPGHGGDDPGAIGPRKTLEKDIVLALAKNLQKTLDSTGEIRAFLTRRGDYFVPLHDRVKIAQEYGADLFISLHCNGSRKRQTRGTSIYCLSDKGASDMATQLLAQNENASDLVGGTSLAPTRRDLDSILLDLEQTHAINESLRLGGFALNEFGRINQIQFTQPRQAGFAVLKAPEFPSILIETAYITNPTEEMMLRRKSFQDRICQSIIAAVKRYLPLLSAKEGSPGGDSFGGSSKKRGG